MSSELVNQINYSKDMQESGVGMGAAALDKITEGVDALTIAHSHIVDALALLVSAGVSFHDATGQYADAAETTKDAHAMLAGALSGFNSLAYADVALSTCQENAGLFTDGEATSSRLEGDIGPLQTSLQDLSNELENLGAQAYRDKQALEMGAGLAPLAPQHAEAVAAEVHRLLG